MGTKTKAKPKGRLMTQGDILEELGISTRLVLRWVQEGQFPAPVRVVNRTRLFSRADVERWEKARQAAQAPPG